MASYLHVQYKDSSEQKSGMTFRTRDVTAANLDAVNAEFSTLRSELDLWTLGNLQNYETTQNRSFVSNGAASSNLAIRENKVLLEYEDNVTNQVYQMELPIVDLSTAGMWINANKKKLMNSAHANYTSFKAAFEATVRSPDGNAVTFKGGHVVGRNI